MKAQDSVGVIFANSVIARGVYQNVINLSFGVFNFTPNEDNGAIDFDHTLVARLRLDKSCAYQLREAMNQLIALIEAEETQAKEPDTEGVILTNSKKRAEKSH